jgi:hypothetical protein
LLARRIAALIRMFAERLGKAALDPLTMDNIKRAAELTALAESLRQRALDGCSPRLSAFLSMRAVRLSRGSREAHC